MAAAGQGDPRALYRYCGCLPSGVTGACCSPEFYTRACASSAPGQLGAGCSPRRIRMQVSAVNVHGTAVGSAVSSGADSGTRGPPPGAGSDAHHLQRSPGGENCATGCIKNCFIFFRFRLEIGWGHYATPGFDRFAGLPRCLQPGVPPRQVRPVADRLASVARGLMNGRLQLPERVRPLLGPGVAG